MLRRFRWQIGNPTGRHQFAIAESGLDSLRDHQLDQVTDAVAVTPFIVVPTDELEVFAVQFDTAPFIENR